MSKLTIASFIDWSGINAGLIRATVRQCGGFEAFHDMAENIAHYGGIDAGYNGWIYYTETTGFYVKNRSEINAYFKSFAMDCYPETNIIGMIKQFNCCKDEDEEEIALTLYGKKSQINSYVANCLAWAIAEEIVARYNNFIYEFKRGE